MSRQSTDNLYIELGYYNPEEYYTYEASAESALANEATMSVTVGVIKNAGSAVNSEFTQTAQAVKLVEGNINLNCEFTQTATISHIEGSDMFAFTEAQIAVQVDRIRDTNIEVSDVFSIATDVVRYRDIASDSVSESTITIGNQRILNFQSAVQGAFSISADVIRFRRSPVALSSTVSLQSSLTGTANARVGFARSPKTITVNGTVTRNTTIKKFGDSSAQFAATGVNYLTITPFSDLNRGTTGDFTIEGWFYHTARGSFFEFRNSQSDDGFYIYTSGTALILFHKGTSLLVVSNVVPQNQWNHIALSRQGSNLRLFANGTQAGSTYTTVVNFNPVRFEIGRRNDSVDPLRGYADEIRISNISRYTVNFTPSTSAFTNDANTLFLSHFDQSPFADDAGTSTTLSQFTLFIVSGNVESGSAGLESAFTINISAGIITLAQSTQTVQTQLSIEAVKSVEASVSLNSEFQQTQSANVSKDIAAALTANSSLSIDFTRLRNAESTFESDSNLNSSVEKLIQLSSDAGSLFDVGVSAVATINSFAILDSSTQLNAVVQANINAGSNISAASNLQSAIEKIITAESSVNSEFSQTTDVIKFKNVVVGMVANAAISTVVTVPTQRPRPVFLNNASSQSRTGIETSIKKFGSASGYVIGTGYAEYTATNGDLSLGTGDFAIEIWMYPVVSRDNDFAILSNPYALTINALVPKMLLGSVTLTSSTAATLNSWNHLVISKTGSRSSMFLNGTRVATSTTAWTAAPSSTLRIRGYSKPAPLDDDPGIYYDDFSFHKGSDIGFDAANTTITIPTEARINLPTGTDPNQTFTQLLVHFDGNFEDDVRIITQVQAGLSATSTVNVSGSTNRSVAASMSSASSVTVVGTTLFNSAASLTSQGFVVAAVARKVDELADLTSTFELSLLGGLTSSAQADFDSSTTVDATATKIHQSAVSITGAFNAEISVTEFEGVGPVTLTAESSLTALINVRSNAGSTVTSTTAITATVSAFSRYWVTVLESEPDNSSSAEAVDSDSNGNVYTVGSYNVDPNPDNNAIVVKYSKLGEILWQTQIATPTSFNSTGTEIVSDSQGNVYITGSLTETYPELVFDDLYVIKLNSGGTVQWSRFLRTGGSNQLGNKIDLDSSGNVYVAGLGRTTRTDIFGLIAKYNSSGTLQWQKRISADSSGIFELQGIVVKDSHFYVTGRTSDPSTLFVAKLDLDGTMVWQKSVRDLVTNDFELGYDIDTDSQGNVYIAGYDTNPERTIFLKFDSLGNLVFQKLIRKTGVEQLFGASMTVDQNDRVLITMGNSGTGHSSIATFNSDGSLLRARFIELYATDIDTDRFDDILLSASSQLTSGEFELTTVKLPGDGSRTGFIDLFGYEVENDLIIESASYTVIDTTNTVSNTTLSTSSYSITQVNGDDLYTVYVINEIVLGSAVLISQFSQSATFGKIRQFSSSVSSTVTQTSTVTKIVRPTVTVSSNFTQSTQVRRIRTGSSNLSTAVTVTITGQRVRFADSQQSATASLTASGDRSRQTSLTVQSSTNLNETSTRIRFADTEFESLATQLTAAGYNATGTVLLESRFESSVEAQKTTDITKTLNAVADINTINDRFRSFDSSITSETNVFAEALNIRPAGSSMEVTTSLSINTDNSRIVGITANSTSEFTQTTINDTLRLAVASLSATATASIIAFKVKQFNIALTSQASIQILTGIRADARADLPAISVQLTVGDVINIDPFYQIKVEQESRQGTVRPENRVIQVEQETRLNMIL